MRLLGRRTTASAVGVAGGPLPFPIGVTPQRLGRADGGPSQALALPLSHHAVPPLATLSAPPAAVQGAPRRAGGRPATCPPTPARERPRAHARWAPLPLRRSGAAAAHSVPAETAERRARRGHHHRRRRRAGAKRRRPHGRRERTRQRGARHRLGGAAGLNWQGASSAADPPFALGGRWGAHDRDRGGHRADAGWLGCGLFVLACTPTGR